MTISEQIQKKRETRRLRMSEILFGDRLRPEEDYGNLEDLANSIRKETGLIEPLVVEYRPDLTGGFQYLLLAGGRRYRAITQFIDPNYEDECRVYFSLDDEERLFIELEENLQRKQLSWDTEVELRAKLHTLRQEKYGIPMPGRPTADTPKGQTIENTAEALGISPRQLGRDLQLAEALNSVPDLRECKTKKEAMKKLERLEEDILVAERARRHREQMNTEGNERKSRLTQCYILGNFFEKVRDVPNELVNMCEVDPPYGINLQDMNYTEGRKMLAEDFEDWDIHRYTDMLPHILEECYRCTKDGGWIILWFSASLFPETMGIAEKSKWKFSKKPGLWTKPKVGRVMDPDRSLTCDYEPFLYGYKGDAKLSKRGRSSLFEYTHAGGMERIHPSEKPIPLLRDLISTFTIPGDRIMSPFLGGGNIILAAHDVDRMCFGFDMNQKFFDRFTMRVQGLAEPTANSAADGLFSDAPDAEDQEDYSDE